MWTPSKYGKRVNLSYLPPTSTPPVLLTINNFQSLSIFDESNPTSVSTQVIHLNYPSIQVVIWPEDHQSSIFPTFPSPNQHKGYLNKTTHLFTKFLHFTSPLASHSAFWQILILSCPQADRRKRQQSTPLLYVNSHTQGGSTMAPNPNSRYLHPTAEE